MRMMLRQCVASSALFLALAGLMTSLVSGQQFCKVDTTLNLANGASQQYPCTRVLNNTVPIYHEVVSTNQATFTLTYAQKADCTEILGAPASCLTAGVNTCTAAAFNHWPKEDHSCFTVACTDAGGCAFTVKITYGYDTCRTTSVACVAPRTAFTALSNAQNPITCPAVTSTQGACQTDVCCAFGCDTFSCGSFSFTHGTQKSSTTCSSSTCTADICCNILPACSTMDCTQFAGYHNRASNHPLFSRRCLGGTCDSTNRAWCCDKDAYPAQFCTHDDTFTLAVADPLRKYNCAVPFNGTRAVFWHIESTNAPADTFLIHHTDSHLCDGTSPTAITANSCSASSTACSTATFFDYNTANSSCIYIGCQNGDQSACQLRVRLRHGRDSCNNFPCPNTKTLVVNAAGVACTTTASSFGACTEAQCCHPKCDVFTCPADHSDHANKATLDCGGVACSKEVCCVPFPKCSTHTCSPSTHVDKPPSVDPSTVTCNGGTCTDAQCCDARQTCAQWTATSGVQCPAWSHHDRANLAGITCVGKLCDKNECCLPNPNCSSLSCPTGLLAKPGGSSIVCGAATCTDAMCCDGLPSCNTNPGGIDPCPARTNRDDTKVCAALTCTVSECCLDNNLCSTYDCVAKSTVAGQGSSWHQNTTANGLRCTVTDCSINVSGSITTECCIQNPYCKDFTCTGALKHLNPTVFSNNQVCTAETCTDAMCCLDNPFCVAADCPQIARLTVKSGFATQQCAGGTCTTAECCIPMVYCDTFTCTGLTHHKHLSPGFPTFNETASTSGCGAACSQEFCCTSNQRCSQATTVAGFWPGCPSGMLLRADFSSVTCSGIACTDGECCVTPPPTAVREPTPAPPPVPPPVFAVSRCGVVECPRCGNFTCPLGFEMVADPLNTQCTATLANSPSFYCKRDMCCNPVHSCLLHNKKSTCGERVCQDDARCECVWLDGAPAYIAVDPNGQLETDPAAEGICLENRMAKGMKLTQYVGFGTTIADLAVNVTLLCDNADASITNRSTLPAISARPVCGDAARLAPAGVWTTLVALGAALAMSSAALMQ